MSGTIVSSILRKSSPIATWQTERDFVVEVRAADVRMARSMAWERCHLTYPQGEFEVISHEVLVKSRAGQSSGDWGQYRVIVRGQNLLEHELDR